jgi:ribosomal protein L11 methyltransferase
VTWVYRTRLRLEEVNLHLEALESAGLLGLAEEAGRTDAYFPERADGLPLAGTWAEVHDEDWSQTWRAGLEPVTVGAIRIASPWLAREGDIVIEPGQAFGTGHHETTTACIAALQELDLDDRSVLDVGTGSGVLAICARRLGARTVLAVDTDPEAVAAARANAAANATAVEVRLGSPTVAPGSYDVVVANLDTATVCRLARELAVRLAAGGTLVVSGVSVERAREAEQALADQGLVCRTRLGREWALLVCRRSAERETPGVTRGFGGAGPP